jgi:signal transduction histidine kinase
VRIPGGIRVRIALALAGIVAASLGAAYVIVIPSLQQRLVDARLDDLEELAVPLAHDLPTNQFGWYTPVERWALRTNARVVAYDVLTRNPPSLRVIADTKGIVSKDADNASVAIAALESGRVERGQTVTTTGEWGDVAVPVEDQAVVLFRVSLADSAATVRLVEQRLLLATAFALALALALGLLAAGVLARRLLRLENAAERIAGGDFGHPVVDRGDDEIGQLAKAFDRMRVQLAQLDTARKEFVANASHELRTPLFSIAGFLELLNDEDIDETTRRDFLTTMQSQVERLTKLSANLLDLSRLDAGQLRVVVEPVDIGEVARTLVRELEHVSAASDHTLEAVVEGDDVWALADEERVLQIGRALVVNALVHTPSGTRVVVRARDRGRAELVVEDDGPGIPEPQQDAIFERFHRAEGVVASGSGLGLAIARELARLMKGDVHVRSRPGRTAFTLEVPREPVPRASRAQAAAFSRENVTARSR